METTVQTDSTMNISMRFAVDRNKNKTIEKEEITSPEALKELDGDDSGSLKGREFTDVYFEYGRDKWLRGGRTEVVRNGGASYYVNLKEVHFDPFRIDMKVDIRM